MNEPTKCPHCNTNLLGEAIPQELIDEGYYAGTHWKREIGIDGGYMGIYDGIVAYQCPDCKHEFPRGSSTWALEMFDKYQKVCRGEEIPEFNPFKIPPYKIIE